MSIQQMIFQFGNLLPAGFQGGIILPFFGFFSAGDEKEQ
jgi:hypothetical protein